MAVSPTDGLQTGGPLPPEKADDKLTKAELLAKLQEARSELAAARAAAKAWYKANPVAVLLIAAVGFAAGAVIF